MLPEDLYFNMSRDVSIQELVRKPITVGCALYYLGLLVFVGIEFAYLTFR